MVSTRETSHPIVRVECPVCGRGLPVIMVDVDARAVRTGHNAGRVLSLTVSAQPLDVAWWRAARDDHPRCIPIELTREHTDGML